VTKVRDAKDTVRLRWQRRLGMGLLGGLMLAGAALLGLHVVLTAVPWAYLGLRVGGGAYLIFLAIQLWRGAHESIAMDEVSAGAGGSLRKFLLLGLATEQAQDSDRLREHLHSLAAGRSAHLGSMGDLADDFPDRDGLVLDRRDRVFIREAAPWLSRREACV
jgi:hypothetical protein